MESNAVQSLPQSVLTHDLPACSTHYQKWMTTLLEDFRSYNLKCNRNLIALIEVYMKLLLCFTSEIPRNANVISFGMVSSTVALKIYKLHD